MRKHALRNLRAKLVRDLRRGDSDLRVVGSEATGFQLGGLHRGEFIVLTGVYGKQKEAVSEGVVNFGQAARKLLPKKAA